MSATVVGEAPGATPVGPRGPLSGPAGVRLAGYAGLDLETFLAVRRVNLFDERPDRWSAPAARDRAGTLLELHRPGAEFVLLGRRVAAAFGAADAEWLSWVEVGGHWRGPWSALVVPHPSGRCHVWNDPRFRARARPVLSRALA